MPTFYDGSVKGHITKDGATVTQIRYSQELPVSDENDPVEAASAYLRESAEVLGLERPHLGSLRVRAEGLAPEEKGIEYRLEDDKRLFDGTTVAFAQTYFDVPVFRRGISVEVKQGPNRIVGVTNNTESGLEGALPSRERIDFYRRLFQDGTGFLGRVPRRANAEAEVAAEGTEATDVVRRTLGLTGPATTRRNGQPAVTGLMNGRFVAYRYQPELRFDGRPGPTRDDLPRPDGEEKAAGEGTTPPFPDVPRSTRRSNPAAPICAPR